MTNVKLRDIFVNERNNFVTNHTKKVKIVQRFDQEETMTIRTMRATALGLAMAFAFTGVSMNAEAAFSGTGSALPSGGVELCLTNHATTLEDISGTESKNSTANKNSADNKSAAVSTYKPAVEQTIEAEAEEPSEEELFRNLVIAQVNNYVNVRSLPSEDGEILGKLYDDSVGNLLDEEDGWYKIESGSVTGYVKAEFCVTGDEAVDLAKEVGTRFATVTTTTLKVRTEPSLEATVLGLVPLEDELVVSDEVEGWVKVDVEEGLGWVSTDYVKLHTEFVKAESKEEEEARLKKEAAEREKARKAAAAKASKSQSSASANTGNNVSAPIVSSGSGSEMGNAVIDYALQFVGNPYVYGGSSLTNGTDCSGFVMSVYANFGVSLPHSSSADRSQGTGVEGGLENAQPGDIVCYSGHVALYVGNGQIVHASTSKTGIIVSEADYKKVLAVRRIF